MKTVTIKNLEVTPFLKVIQYNMPFQRGRIRNELLKILVEKEQAIINNRKEMLTALSNKDKEGNPIIKDDSFDLTEPNRLKFVEEFQKMIVEECVIDLPTSLEKSIGDIKQMINASSVELDYAEAENVSGILEALSKDDVGAIKSKKPKK